MSNSHGSLNAQGGSENQDFTKEPTLEYASKGGGSQEAGQQRLLESAGEHPWDQSMDPLWQHDESWILNGPQISSTVQSNPNPIELSLFPQPTGAPAQTYLGTDQEAHIRLGPVDLGEGDGNRLHSAPWPGADPGRPELAPWYPYQLSLKPSVAERVRQRSGPSTKPPKNIREVQIPRASRSENIVTTSQEDTEKPHKCERCPARFARKRDCERHGRSVHTGSKLYHCKGCTEGFVRSDARGRHWKLNPDCHQIHLQAPGTSNRSSPSA